MHTDFMQILAADRFETLRRDAQPIRGYRPRPVVDTRDVELRLCRIADDPQLQELAELDSRPLPPGRLVLAVVRGRIVAALPLAGGPAIRNPFVRTAHLLPLLELRAGQLRDPQPRRFVLPRYAGLARRSTHA